MRYFVLLLLVFISGCSASPERQPNIILFVVDDLGWTDLGCYGSDLYQTPHIDRLANSGMRFTDAYSACTVCSPSRSSIMTGKYPARTNTTDWISGHQKPFARMKVPEWTQFMDPGEVTLAEILKGAGYLTIHIGKWHLGEEEIYWPENQGFEQNIGGWSVGAPQKGSGGNGYFPPYLNPRLPDGPEGEYLTERLSHEAVEFIEASKKGDAPFFMNFWFYNVHTPLQAKKEKIEKYEKLAKDGANHINPVYAAMVEHMDDAIGQVIKKLEDSGMLHNTLILFTSDNGGLRGNFENRGTQVTNNFPLRSGKGDIYEGGVRVPFIASWDGRIPNATTSDVPVISADVYPTILGLAGIQGDDKHNQNMDGIDISSLLTEGESVSRDALFWHYPHYHLEGAKPYSAVRKGDWKLIEVFENDSLELYNLRDDIGERVNLVSEFPDKATELTNALNNWRNTVNAQIPQRNPHYDKRFETSWKSGVWRSKSNAEFKEHLKENN
ncbi:MAG TPA: sulfatase [Eudoraea sp.]|nr:sulfatase [Eudoraea sp.]